MEAGARGVAGVIFPARRSSASGPLGMWGPPRLAPEVSDPRWPQHSVRVRMGLFRLETASSPAPPAVHLKPRQMLRAGSPPLLPFCAEASIQGYSAPVSFEEGLPETLWGL